MIQFVTLRGRINQNHLAEDAILSTSSLFPTAKEPTSPLAAGYILVEGDIANPKVIEAIGKTRENMNSHDRELDPDQISRTPSGEVELTVTMLSP